MDVFNEVRNRRKIEVERRGKRREKRREKDEREDEKIGENRKKKWEEVVGRGSGKKKWEEEVGRKKGKINKKKTKKRNKK